MWMCVSVHLNVYEYVCVKYMCGCVRVSVGVHVELCECTHACVYVCEHVCGCACVSVWTCV